MILEFFAVGIGGFIGANARWGLSMLCNTLSLPLPLGTLLANLIAGFSIGLFVALEPGTGFSKETRLFVTTGLLGGLSTFSTFSLETVQLFRQEQYLWGSWNVILNLSLSLLAVLAGMLLGKLLKKA